MPSGRPAVLVICDGWGWRADTFGNAIAQARTPVWDRLLTEYPHTTLRASGTAVGLPEGQQGNSEVGHLTIGAGRVILQPLERINQAIAEGSFFDNQVLAGALARARDDGKAVHCLGLVSPGGVHSNQRHGVALAEMAERAGVERVHFHVFTDGRDEPPRSAATFVADFARDVGEHGASIDTMAGRYYAMDRDHRWDRTERAYRALTGSGPQTDLSPVEYIEHQYTAGISDEFIEPVRFAHAHAIATGDCVIFWNFRPDRARQLSHALIDDDFSGFARGPRIPGLQLVTFTEYDRELSATVAFPRQDVRETLGEVVSANGLRQFHVAETEKYAHVTYFINGGREAPFDGEERLLVPSPKVATYDTTPRMSADAITDAVVEHLANADCDLIVANFANPDMVGHTGEFAPTIEAVECVDSCLGRIDEAVRARHGLLVITADHGNAEQKINPADNSPLTAHTTNPVPLVVCGSDITPLRPEGGLQDVAPTLLRAMAIEAPHEMSGRDLAATVRDLSTRP